MSEHKVNAKLLETPATEMCGDPNRRDHPGAIDTLYGLQGPEGFRAGIDADQVLVYDDITPNKADDAPDTSKLFKGQSPER
jgi:hypothetical protein